jgi:hypothetical protein
VAINYANHYTVRRDLVIRSSEDSGKTWEESYSAFLGSTYEAPFNTDYNPYSCIDSEENIHIADIGGNVTGSTGVILCYNYNGVQTRTYIESPSYGTNFTYFVLAVNNSGVGKLFVTFVLPTSGDCQLNVYTFNLGSYVSLETFNLGASVITPTAAKFMGDNRWLVTIGTYLYEYDNGVLTQVINLNSTTVGAIITDDYVVGETFNYDIKEETRYSVSSSGGYMMHMGVSKKYVYRVYTIDYLHVTVVIYTLPNVLKDSVVIPWGNELRGYTPDVRYDAECPINSCSTSDNIELAMFMIEGPNLSDVVDGPTDVMFVKISLGLGSASAGPHKEGALKTNNKYGTK